MKKYTRVLALVLCCLLLGGCTMPSDTAMLIDRIGTVTLVSGEDIRAAEQSYDRLFVLLRGSVENYETLVAARTLYDSMVAAQAQLEAEADAIGTVNLSSEGALRQLRENYEANQKRYAPEQFDAFGKRLQEMEKAYRRCVLEDQLKTAEALYELKKYNEALELAKKLISHPEAVFIRSQCSDLAKRCDQALTEEKKAEARRLLDAKDPVGALEVLGTISSLHSNSDASAMVDEAFDQLESRRPKNGKVLKKTLGSGKNVFKVTMPEGSDLCIKLESVKDPGKYILFYVRGGKSTSVKVPSGSYTLKYVSGEYWIDTTTYFYALGGFMKANETMDFKSTSFTYTKITVKFEESTQGNMTETPISIEDF